MGLSKRHREVLFHLGQVLRNCGDLMPRNEADIYKLKVAAKVQSDITKRIGVLLSELVDETQDTGPLVQMGQVEAVKLILEGGKDMQRRGTTRDTAASQSAREIGRDGNAILADVLSTLRDFEANGFDLRGQEFDEIRNLIHKIAATDAAREDGG